MHRDCSLAQKRLTFINEIANRCTIFLSSGGVKSLSAPVDHVTDGAEVMAHVQRADVAHARQRQVELESLLPVTSDL